MIKNKQNPLHFKMNFSTDFGENAHVCAVSETRPPLGPALCVACEAAVSCCPWSSHPLFSYVAAAIHLKKESLANKLSSGLPAALSKCQFTNRLPSRVLSSRLRLRQCWWGVPQSSWMFPSWFSCWGTVRHSALEGLILKIGVSERSKIRTMKLRRDSDSDRI